MPPTRHVWVATSTNRRARPPSKSPESRICATLWHLVSMSRPGCLHSNGIGIASSPIPQREPVDYEQVAEVCQGSLTPATRSRCRVCSPRSVGWWFVARAAEAGSSHEHQSGLRGPASAPDIGGNLTVGMSSRRIACDKRAVIERKAHSQHLLPRAARDTGAPSAPPMAAQRPLTRAKRGSTRHLVG
jgi:hypothetical protein